MIKMPVKAQNETLFGNFQWFIFAVLFVTLLRFLSIYGSNTDLFFDEAQYWAWSRSLDFGYFSKPPFLAWSIRSVTELCGINEFCIRASSPIFHALTSLLIFFAAKAAYGRTVALLPALVYLTLPGVSFSSGHISTDVPLLAFWTLALWALIEFRKKKSWPWAILLGVALGLGLLSKYAMAFFFVCALVYALFSKEAVTTFRNPKLLISLFIAILLLSPNIIWNLQNELVTLSHTKDNINWTGSLIKPDKAIEFFAAQFGVFGPILFTILLLLTWRFLTGTEQSKIRVRNEQDKLLLAFSIPVILLITTQAFLSRAHANWAATAYPAATILVTSILIRHREWGLIKLSFLLHLTTIAALIIGSFTAGSVALPFKLAPYARVLGWKELVDRTEKRFREGQYSALLTKGRDISAEMVYYLRNTNIPVYAWKRYEKPIDYFQMVQPYNGEKLTKPLLAVSRFMNPKDIERRFRNFKRLGSETVTTGKNKNRTLYFFSVSGYIALPKQ